MASPGLTMAPFFPNPPGLGPQELAPPHCTWPLTANSKDFRPTKNLTLELKLLGIPDPLGSHI